MIIITNYYKHVMKHHNKHVLSCYIELFYTKHRSSPPTLIVLPHIQETNIRFKLL